MRSFSTPRSWHLLFGGLLPLGMACLRTGDAPRSLDLAAREDRPRQPVELGLVRWERDHDAAFARGAREEKPVLLFFQEVPG